MIIVGLGNPGAEYEMTRHNMGRVLVDAAAQKAGADFFESGKHQSLVAKGEVAGTKATFVLPETYMNKTGSAVKTLVTSAAHAKKLVVVYDDIDLPFGTVRIAFGRGSGGHNGIESIIRALKTKDFVRIRVGVAPTAPSGKIKKPRGEDAVVKFLMGTFGKNETAALPKLKKFAIEILETIASEGYVVAMNRFN